MKAASPGMSMMVITSIHIPARIEKRTIEEATPGMSIMVPTSVHPAKLRRGVADSQYFDISVPHWMGKCEKKRKALSNELITSR